MDTRETAEGIFELLNAHDVDAVSELWTDETVEHFPHGEIRGTDDLHAFFSGMIAAMPDIHWNVHSIVIDGETACVHWTITGHFTGESFMGFDATGSVISMDGMDKFVFADGKINTAHIVYDQLGFARQIGAMPDDGTVADLLLKALFNLRAKVRTRRRA